MGGSQFAQSRTLKVSERSEEFRIGVKRDWFEICGPKRVQRSEKEVSVAREGSSSTAEKVPVPQQRSWVVANLPNLEL